MRAFVTGGAGFLGRHVVAQLLRDGHDVVCLLRGRSRDEALRTIGAASESRGTLTIVRGALARPDTYRAALAGADVLLHVAAEMSGPAAVLFATNVAASRTLFETALAARMPRVVLVSSIAVYGAGALPSGGVVDETCPLDARPQLRDVYTYSKVAQEQMAWTLREERGLPLVVVRPGVIYGPGRDWLCSRIGLRFGGLMLKMGGRQRVPFTYVENCADAVVQAAGAPGIEGQAFSIVDDDLPTADALVRRHRRAVGRIRTVWIPSWAVRPLSRLNVWYHRVSRGQLPAVLTPYRSDAHWRPMRYTNDKARRVLGWQPRVSVDVGLSRTAASLRATTAAR